MAFCPNCGTANTEQAEKCVACGHELTQQQRARFKGTIMMSGTQLPAGVVPKTAPNAAPPPAAAAPATAPPAESGGPVAPKAFAKTMLGAAISLPLPAAPAPGESKPRANPTDLGSAATLHSAAAVPYARTVEAPHLPSPAATPAPGLSPDASGPATHAEPARVDSARREPAAAAQGGHDVSYGSAAATLDAPLPSSAGSRTGQPQATGPSYGSQPSVPPVGRDFGSTSMAAPKAGPGKAILFGCAGALAVAALSAFGIYMFARDSVSNLLGGSDAQVAAAWRKSVGQAVEQVAQLCAQDCSAAAIYFHPQTQTALLGEAKLLTPERATKLATGAHVQARMLSDSDDSSVATKLKLDPGRCVELVLGEAQVVGCSVIDGAGVESLRLVHLAGIGTL